MATDMSRHMNDLNEMKAICEKIPEGGTILQAAGMDSSVD